MRAMPNMLIASPGDPMEVRACMRYLINNPQPSYLRLGKAGEKNLHTEVPELKPGKWLRFGSSAAQKTLLTTGAPLALAKSWVDKSPAYKDFAIHSLPLWGMKWKSIQPEQIQEWSEVLTLEDHLLDGGFGSWLMESSIIQPNLLSRLRFKYLDPSVCGLVGKQEILNAMGGLVP